jgi:putative hydrolase of the HAD superfamily
MIKAILFDAAGTLIHLPRGVGWHYRQVAARHGLDLDESRAATAFAQAFRAAGPRVVTGISRPDDDKGWWREVVSRMLITCGEEPADPVFDPMFEELYSHFAEPGVWALYPEVAAVLNALHGRYRLGVVSNFDRRLYPVLDHLGIRYYFQTIVVSSEHGFDKPDIRLFAPALAALGVSPAETLHVGDDPIHDWRAAESAGINVFRLARPGTTLETLPSSPLLGHDQPAPL